MKPVRFRMKRLQQLRRGTAKRQRKFAFVGGIQQGVLPLPKSTHQERMAQNTDIFDFELTDSEMTRISALENLGGQCMVPDDVDF